MFEDATFESNGKIRTRSRFWIFAALALNSTVLLTAILIPLIFPDALGRRDALYLMQVPPPPAPAQPVQPKTPQQVKPTTAKVDQFAAPRTIPTTILMVDKPEPPTNTGNSVTQWAVVGGTGDGGPSTIFNGAGKLVVIKPAIKAPIRVSSMVVAGLLLHKTVPEYPPIARAAHVEGTVVLGATISRTGTIEDVHVVSGQPMLQTSAVNAVKTWAYRPYLLNGEPVAVETTVNVIFSLGH